MNTTRIAVTTFGSVVSPLFDTAQVLELFEVAEGKTRRVENLSLGDLGLDRRMALLARYRAQVLICGAISDYSHHTLLQLGIQVHPWVSGEVAEVMAFLAARYDRERQQATLRKVAVSTVGDSLDSEVGPYSRRCPFLLVVDLEHLSAITLHSRSASGELGVLCAARLITDAGAMVLLTSRCGPNAMGSLSAVGITTVPGAAGRVGDAVEEYQRGDLPAMDPAVSGQCCTAGAPGRNPGPGFRGRPRSEGSTMEHRRHEHGGMGRGRGRGGGGRGGRRRGQRGGGGGRGNGAGRARAGGETSDGEGEPGGVRGMLNRVLQVMTGDTNRGGLLSTSELRQGGWGRPSPISAPPSREQFPVPVVVPELCTGCGICQQACGPEAIKVVGELAVIDETECISCEACVQSCPERAVRIPQ